MKQCYYFTMIEDTENTIIGSLFARKSVRSFTGDPVPEVLRNLIIDAAIQAPTAGNQVLYTILDIRDQEIKDRLAVLCDHQPFIAAAPMVLIFLADCRKWLEIYRSAGIDPRDPGVGDMMIALADALIASQNSVTAAWSLGIGSCYIGDVLEQREDLIPLLHLKPFLIPAAMVVFGYPTEQQKDRPKPKRFSRDLVVRRDRYRDLREGSDGESGTIRGELARLHRKDGEGFDFSASIQAFHKRKYASDFAREMNRSAEGYVRQFLKPL